MYHPCLVGRDVSLSGKITGCERLQVDGTVDAMEADIADQPRHSSAGTTVIGLISDTHGLLRPEAAALLRGSDFIIHAGDVGDPRVLQQLATLAPVTAVRGNVDTGDWAAALPETAVLTVGPVRILVIHRIEDLTSAAGFDAVIYGHSHKPGHHRKDGVLYVNPGSAGPRRFSLPISLARLTVDGADLSVTSSPLA